MNESLQYAVLCSRLGKALTEFTANNISIKTIIFRKIHLTFYPYLLIDKKGNYLSIYIFSKIAL